MAVAVYGLEGAMALSRDLRNEALSCLGAFGAGADYFRNLTEEMYKRNH